MSSAQILKKSKISVEIDDLPLNPELIQKVKEANLHTYASILHLSEAELRKNAKLSARESSILLNSVSQIIADNNPEIAFSLYHSELNSMKFAVNLLNNEANTFDGIFPSTITEICGESGSGKTQICLHLSIQAQKPIKSGGLDTRVMYLHSEGEFPIRRYLQMSNAFKKNNPEFQNLKLSDNLMLKKVLSLPQLMHTLQSGIPDLLKKANSPKLIIIDSVAALLRSEYDTLDERTTMVKSLAAEIWKLSKVFKTAVICVNQVSGACVNNKAVGLSKTDVPSLGLLWSNVLTTRLKIFRKPTEDKTRVLEVIFSAYHALSSTNFIISEDGIVII